MFQQPRTREQNKADYIAHLRQMVGICWKLVMISAEIDGDFDFRWQRYISWTDKLMKELSV